MQETQILSLGLEYPLEKEMATHSSVLAWKVPWTEEPGGLHGVAKQSDMAEKITLDLIFYFHTQKVSLQYVFFSYVHWDLYSL